ncbi:MAG: hypothetical protein RL094_288 [Candidatus Parcubacteria bacterium]|jgi:predicted kinase
MLPELRAQIKQEFIDSLLLSEKPSSQCIVIPVGFIGSGKTTVMQYLAEKMSLIRLSNDELRVMLLKHGQDFSELKAIAKEVLDEHLQKGYSIAIDGNGGTQATKAFIEELARKHKVPVFWVRIHAPEEVILEHIRGRKNALLTNDNEVMVRNYYAQKEESLKNPVEISFFGDIDTSKDDVVAQMDGLASAIKETLSKA